MAEFRIKATGTTFFERQKLERRIARTKHRRLESYGKLTITISRRSMKKAPNLFTKTGKRRRISKYGRYRQVKSGKKFAAAQADGRYSVVRFQKGMHSPPGVPPYHHNPAIGLRDQRFQIEGDEIVIHTRRLASRKYSTGAIPLLHELGGSSAPGDARGNDSRSLNRRTRRYPPRPFMTPAGTKALKTFRRQMKNAIK